MCTYSLQVVHRSLVSCVSACEKVWILNLQTAGRFSAAKSELSDCEIRSLDPCLVKFVFEALKATCVAGSFWNSSGGDRSRDGNLQRHLQMLAWLQFGHW